MSLISYSVAVSAEGTTALSGATSGIAQYIPYVRGVIWSLAALVAVVGSVVVYIRMQNENARVQPMVITLIGSCIFLVCSAIALPEFFGYEDNGSFTMANSSNGSGSSSSGSSSSSSGNNSYGNPINTEIPDLSDPRWHDDPQYGGQSTK